MKPYLIYRKLRQTSRGVLRSRAAIAHLVARLCLAIGLYPIAAQHANATLVDIEVHSGGNGYEITDMPPEQVSRNPNDGVLTAWDEVQDYTLGSYIEVDEIFDESSSLFEEDEEEEGVYVLKEGVVVSSHYIQWDPRSRDRIKATVTFDAPIIAIISSDENLAASDDELGLPGLLYDDFNLRGLEGNDVVVISEASLELDWAARSPGDWVRVITEPTYTTTPVPEPSTYAAFGSLALVLAVAVKRWKRKSKR